MLNGLDLFSGGGGLAEGLHRWVRPVAYCEVEPGAQRVLLSRMARGELYPAPIWDDVRTLRRDILPQVDIIAGGFPCQDISVAGSGAGLAGERSGLVFDYIRLIGECKPRFVLMENVAALSVRGLDRVLLKSMHWGMMHDGLLFQLQRWAPRISDSESGYSPIPGTHVPTPTATAISNSRTAAKDGSMHGVSLAHFVRMWPTPVASEGEKGGPGRKHGDGSPTLSRAVHLWTTPCVDDTSHRKEKYAQGGTAMSTQAGGQLNPTWVEWLMGWPIGSTVCESWVTESSHFARRKRL